MKGATQYITSNGNEKMIERGVSSFASQEECSIL